MLPAMVGTKARVLTDFLWLGPEGLEFELFGYHESDHSAERQESVAEQHALLRCSRDTTAKTDRDESKWSSPIRSSSTAD